jgi:hypothetical protein
VYQYYGYDCDLKSVIRETPRNPDGGTLAVNLGIVAIESGFAATIFSYNLHVFDPIWHRLGSAALVDKLRRRQRAGRSQRQQRALRAYTRFLTMGGKLRFQELSRDRDQE